MEWSETRQSLFEYGKGWSGHPGCCLHQTSWCLIDFHTPKVWRYDNFWSKILSSPPIPCPRQLMPGTAHVLRDGSGDWWIWRLHHFEWIFKDPLNGLDLENIPNQEQVFQISPWGTPGERPGTAGTLSTNSVIQKEVAALHVVSCTRDTTFTAFPQNDVQCIAKKNLHHLIFQSNNKLGVTSLGTTGQIYSCRIRFTAVPTIWALIKFSYHH